MGSANFMDKFLSKPNDIYTEVKQSIFTLCSRLLNGGTYDTVYWYLTGSDNNFVNGQLSSIAWREVVCTPSLSEPTLINGHFSRLQSIIKQKPFVSPTQKFSYKNKTNNVSQHPNFTIFFFLKSKGWDNYQSNSAEECGVLLSRCRYWVSAERNGSR